MASNDRALILVQEKRQRDEDKALEAWVFCRNQIATYETQIKQVEAYRQDYIRQMESEGRNGFQGRRLIAFQAFIEKLDNIIVKQKQELERIRMLTEQKRQLYLNAQKNRKIIESLLEKHKIKRLKAEQKAEQKLLDDYVVSTYTRRQQSEAIAAQDYE